MTPSQLTSINDNYTVKLVHATRHSSPDEPVEMTFSVTDRNNSEQTITAHVDSRELYQDEKQRNQVRPLGSASRSSYASSRNPNEIDNHARLVYATKNELADSPVQIVFAVREGGNEWLEYAESDAHELYQLCIEKGWASQPSAVRRTGSKSSFRAA